jgi:predicted acyltransferase
MTAAARRLDSLDVFRGAAVAGMILVSTPGNWSAVYPVLDHAAWHGWTPTDLVFPFLLFAMGAAIPFALARRRTTGDRLHLYVLRRALILIALGFVLNAIESPAPVSPATFRLPGVLQRIGLVYLIAVLVSETFSTRGRVLVAVFTLLGYWAALTLIPVPGVGAGVLTPAGNVASFIDRAVFGAHMLTPEYDPEGLLSTIPAVVTALLGALAGTWLGGPARGRRVAWLFAGGVLTMTAGLLWGRVFPINKNLWTSSFTLFTAGLAAQVLAVCEWTAARQSTRWLIGPLAAFGRNALVAYFLSVGLDSLLTRVAPGGTPIKATLYRVGFASWLRPCCGAEAASLAYAAVYVALWGAVLLALYKRGVFIAI